jgi:hypothetical protein
MVRRIEIAFFIIDAMFGFSGIIYISLSSPITVDTTKSQSISVMQNLPVWHFAAPQGR